MKDFSDCYKAYTVTSEAPYAKISLYAKDCVEDIAFGYYYYEGGTSSEMSITWEIQGDRPVPYFKCHNGAFAALATFEKVIEAMAEFDDRCMTPGQFREILDRRGFVDETDRGPR